MIYRRFLYQQRHGTSHKARLNSDVIGRGSWFSLGDTSLAKAGYGLNADTPRERGIVSSQAEN